MTFTKTSTCAADMDAIAKDFLHLLETLPQQSQATIIGLSGDLGSGKTTFVQAVARALGIAEPVTSPTFVLEKKYSIPPTAKSIFTHLVHIDAYRLASPTELVTLGFSDITADSAALIFIEWPERLGDLFPPNTPTLFFNHADETTRTITTAKNLL